MITLQSLGLKIEEKILFHNISMTFLPSSIVMLRGKNGAGKTSFLRIMAGLQQASSGKLLFSKEQFEFEYLAKPYCTYIGHKCAIKNELSTFDNINYWANIFCTNTLVEAAIRYFQLEDILYIRCSDLSAGLRKKIAMTRLILCPAKLWLLDEIDTNLDSSNKELLTKLIISHADNGGYSFIASHDWAPVKTISTLNLNDYA
ncbi:MAG: heme ABC exporter ATP-binding protein CcmA [Rickettsiaceae bacterium]|nr:heme ABC exporter ATP-binding protein CcmA [Rickettsiaceae bacterium]